MKTLAITLLAANLYGAQAIIEQTISIGQVPVVQQHSDTCSYHAIRNTDIMLSGQLQRLTNHKEAAEFVAFCDRWLPLVAARDQLAPLLFQYLKSLIPPAFNEHRERFEILLSRACSQLIYSYNFSYSQDRHELVYDITWEKLKELLVKLVDADVKRGRPNDQAIARIFQRNSTFDQVFRNVASFSLIVRSNGEYLLQGSTHKLTMPNARRGDTNNVEMLVNILRKSGRIVHDITLYSFDEPHIFPDTDLGGMTREAYRWGTLQTNMSLGNDHLPQMRDNIRAGRDFNDGVIILLPPRFEGAITQGTEQDRIQALTNQRTDTHWISLVVSSINGHRTYLLADSIGTDRRNDYSVLELISLLEGEIILSQMY